MLPRMFHCLCVVLIFFIIIFFCLGDIKIFFMAEEDVFVSKVLAEQAGGPAFNSSAPIKKKRQEMSGTAACPVNQHCASGDKGYLKPASQLTLTNQ